MALKGYPSDVSDEEWAFVAPYLALMREDAPQRAYPLRGAFHAPRALGRAAAQRGAGGRPPVPAAGAGGRAPAGVPARGGVQRPAVAGPGRGAVAAAAARPAAVA